MGGHTHPPKTIFNISAVSSTCSEKNVLETAEMLKTFFLTFLQFRAHFQKKKARNCRNVKNVNSKFWMLKKKVLETAEMLKIRTPMVQKTFNIFSIFNISAVSSPFFFNIENLELTLLTFLQFRAFFLEMCSKLQKC